MKIHLIWAQDINGGIGKNNKLPWYIPQDLKNFKKITLDKIIIMGRRTWESLPTKPLPKRRNIVLTNNQIDNIECYSSITNCMDELKFEKEVYIIGGATLYMEFIKLAQFLHITFVNIEDKEIDTFFPCSMEFIKQKFYNIDSKILSNNSTYTLWKIKTSGVGPDVINHLGGVR